ncbi:hypothetical protein TIFTF001_031078 [Ficus carica]|uniref:Uncharacterized protein n=1 Tax=Ficus carica TaxID=3494 RepID=A0AA88DVR6_FICCA|nr:hypothetical protein TIFTF001_031078 [Ficus carica]
MSVMELPEDLVMKMEKTESQDRRRFQVDDDEISSDFIAIPFVTRIYLSRPTVATSTGLQASVAILESRSPSEIRHDLLWNCNLLGEIRHDLESEDRDAGEILVYVIILISTSTSSLFLF